MRRGEDERRSGVASERNLSLAVAAVGSDVRSGVTSLNKSLGYACIDEIRNEDERV